MDLLEKNVLYTLDRAFRAYHQHAQKQVRMAGYEITIDQWLLLKTVSEHPDITQNDVAKIVVKDNASVTRIIQLLVDAGFLKRENHATDRRRVVLKLTSEGSKITLAVNEVAIANRKTALKGLTVTEIEALKNSLQKILNNCKTK